MPNTTAFLLSLKQEITSSFNVAAVGIVIVLTSPSLKNLSDSR